ncbi:hypothetical protein HDV06_006963 [Boothiomyces sp. JEL0866]|nr:hypothetical protein HDV06_006963 [Boothiomyces sp. JEL0866]
MLNTSVLTELKLILIAKLSKRKVPSLSKRITNTFSSTKNRDSFDIHKKVVVDYSKDTKSVQVIDVSKNTHRIIIVFLLLMTLQMTQIFMNLVLALINTTSALVLESVWTYGECQGPPTSMAAYDQNLISSYLLTFTENDYVFPTCGVNPISTSTGCCGSSLDLELTFDYQSWSELPVSSGDLVYSPKSANNYSYCVLYPYDEDSLDSYRSIYALAGSSCTINGIQCFGNRTIRIFNDSTCDGTYEQFSMDSSQPLNSLVYGNITVDLITVVNGTESYSWVAYSPVTIEVPSTYKKLLPIEYFAYVTMF